MRPRPPFGKAGGPDFSVNVFWFRIDFDFRQQQFARWRRFQHLFWKPQHYERLFLWQFLTKRPRNEASEASEDMTTLKLQLPMITDDLFQCCAVDLTRFLPINSIFRWILLDGKNMRTCLFINNINIYFFCLKLSIRK